MPILNLLERVNTTLIHPPHPMLNKDAALRRNYLMGIAMQAYCDARLDDRERVHFFEIAKAFDVSEEEAAVILASAKDPDEAAVNAIRDHLLHNKFKYYFIIDLNIMAHQDHQFEQVERRVIEQFGRLLQIDEEDILFFTELAEAVMERDPQAKQEWLDKFFENVRIAHVVHVEDFQHYTDDSNFAG